MVTLSELGIKSMSGTATRQGIIVKVIELKDAVLIKRTRVEMMPI